MYAKDDPLGIICPTCCSRPGEKCMSRNRNYVSYYHIRRELDSKDSWKQYIREQETKFAIERRKAEVDY